MARRSRHRRRDNNSIAKRSLPFGSQYILSPFDRARQLEMFDRYVSRPVEDRRQWHPEGENRPILQKSGRPARHRPKSRQSTTNRALNIFGWKPEIPTFSNPSSVSICEKRSIREQVMHALKKTGKIGQRRPRRNWTSAISCRKKK